MLYCIMLCYSNYLIEYCCAMWDNCGKTNQQYLDKLYRAAGIINGQRVLNQTGSIHTFIVGHY